MDLTKWKPVGKDFQDCWELVRNPAKGLTLPCKVRLLWIVEVRFLGCQNWKRLRRPKAWQGCRRFSRSSGRLEVRTNKVDVHFASRRFEPKIWRQMWAEQKRRKVSNIFVIFYFGNFLLNVETRKWLDLRIPRHRGTSFSRRWRNRRWRRCSMPAEKAKLEATNRGELWSRSFWQKWELKRWKLRRREWRSKFSDRWNGRSVGWSEKPSRNTTSLERGGPKRWWSRCSSGWRTSEKEIWWKQTDCRPLETSEVKSRPATFASRLFLRERERKSEAWKIGVAFWHSLELEKFSADVWPKLQSIISLGWAWCLVLCRASKWNREMKWRRKSWMSWQFWERGEFQQGWRVSIEYQLGQLFRPQIPHE